MIAPLLILTSHPAATPSPITCDIGRLAIQDFFADKSSGLSDMYIDDRASADSVFSICPALREALPGGARLADQDAWRRASIHVPTPGRIFTPAFIYSVKVPQSTSNPDVMTVTLTYTCSGLCGGALMIYYDRTPRGWQRRFGPFRVLSVS